MNTALTHYDFFNIFLIIQAIPTKIMRQNSSRRKTNADPKFLSRFNEEKPRASKYSFHASSVTSSKVRVYS